MATHSVKVERAARKFLSAILPSESFDYTGHPAKSLVVSAFGLYAEAWRGCDIERWEWPFKTLFGGEAFEGNEPWTILFCHAVKLADANHP